jgi:drug/metabolite transporter (DMT)-like permease
MSKPTIKPYLGLATGIVAVSFASIFIRLVTGHSFSGYPGQTYLMFFLLAVVPQIIGHSSFNWALRYLPATFVVVSTLGEPVGSTILAHFILHEVPTLAKISGGVLILTGIYISSRVESVAEAAG